MKKDMEEENGETKKQVFKGDLNRLNDMSADEYIIADDDKLRNIYE